jgi:autotransporter-associated beta strand protein
MNFARLTAASDSQSFLIHDGFTGQCRMGYVLKHRKHRWRRSAAIAVAVLPLFEAFSISAARASTLAGTVSFIPIDTSAYGVNDLNSVGISRDNLATVGNYQYVAYYRYVNTSTATITLGRRTLNSSSWTLVTTPYTISIANNGVDGIITNAIDDHDVVSIAVDGNGDMHMSWGMHNIALNYAISNNAVNGTTFAPTFTTQTPSNNPDLFAEFTSSGISQATYPEFYYTPNSNGTPSGNLLFTIRDAASSTGGGSGNGNNFLSVYNSSTGSTGTGFAPPIEMLNGGITSVNGYQNNLVYDHSNNLLASWTWRGTSNFQTNTNILFAQSSNNGTSWTQQGGSPAYTLPIIANTSNGGLTTQVAQTIEAIGPNSSLINQTGMTVDANNNPIIATWWTPNGNASEGVSATNNPNRQYILVYYTGSQWKTSQITNRTTDTAFDTPGNLVRDVGRPLVMVDNQGRVLVVTRSDNAMGAYTNSGGSGNNIVVYWNTVASLDSANPYPWQPITLDTANMGEWEPSMDYNLWKSSNILDLLYEPSGFSGQTTGSAQVLQWNEQAYFAVATPSSLTWSVAAPGSQDGTGIWDSTHTNWTALGGGYAWNNSFSSYATFGVGNGSAGVVTLGGNITAQSITFNPAGSGNYNIAGGGFTLSMPAGATITANTTATISAPLSVPGNLNKLGSGTLILSGTNSILGTVLLGSSATSGGNVNGALQITTAEAVAGVTNIDFTDGVAAYDIFQINGSNGSITLPSNLSFTLAGNALIANANVIENIAGNNTINGTISPTYNGNQYAVQSDAGTLTINSNFSLGGLGTARYLNLTGAGSGNWVGVLGNGTGGGTLGITKLGSGNWTLSNTETFTGLTNISAGTLTIATGASLASPTVMVASGASLNVFGTLNAGTALGANGSVLMQPFTSAGFHVRTIASLSIGASGNVSMVDSTVPTNRSVLVLGSLTLTGTTNARQGQLDLSNNDLVIHSGSLADVFNEVAAGYNSGSWNGAAGIISSIAAASTAQLTALGVIQNSTNGSASGPALYSSFDSTSVSDTDVLVKFTYYGDANLDGKVDGSGYSRIDSGYRTGSTGWFNGDFNYDGIVNGSDYTLIDNAFNTQGVQLSVQLADVTSQVAVIGNASPSPAPVLAPVLAPVSSPVPEPASLGLVAISTAGALRRRRSRR